MSKRGPKAPADGAAQALRTAWAWTAELESGDLSRVDIACREGISRARVTQVLGLLRLPAKRQRELLSGEAVASIRAVLMEVKA